MRVLRSNLIGPLFTTLIALAAACSSGGTASTGIVAGESDVTRSVLTGLEQRITLVPAAPVAGQDVRIHSTITNHGSNPVALESRICDLDLGGDLRLEWPPGIGACAAYSWGGSISPGESRVSSALRRVASQAGTYTLRVRHALRPELWVEMRVVVRAR
jgi:hypothetical protein